LGANATPNCGHLASDGSFVPRAAAILALAGGSAVLITAW
jgi:hypothetical protein